MTTNPNRVDILYWELAVEDEEQLWADLQLQWAQLLRQRVYDSGGGVIVVRFLLPSMTSTRPREGEEDKGRLLSSDDMEQPAQGTQVARGFTGASQAANAAQTNRPAAAVAGAPVIGMIHPAFAVPPHDLFSYPQVPQFQQPQLQQLLQKFWCNQMQEIERTTDYKNHCLPLARIRKIMKANEKVRMISSDAPAIFSKACEIFIRELTLRSWFHTEENRRRMLQKKDLACAISGTHMFDFQTDIVQRDEIQQELAEIPRSLSVPGEQMPYLYMSAHADPVAVTAAAAANDAQDPAAGKASGSGGTRGS